MLTKPLYRLLTILFFALSTPALASVSLMTGATLPGAERLSSSDSEARILDDVLRRSLLGSGQTCLFTEHHRYDRGLGYAQVTLLKSSLELSGWKLEELSPFLPSKIGLWLLSKGRDVVLVFLIPLERVGYVSFCELL